MPLGSYFANSSAASSCGILSEAVLNQSEVAVDSALRNSPSSVWERNILGQTPLHLAAGWPLGVARLLEAGADINTLDNHSLTPLLYACSAQCLNAIQQLLAEGSALRSHIDQGHSRSVCSALELALPRSTCNINIIGVLIKAPSARRKQLLKLATEILPAERIKDSHITEGRTLDECASDVYDALKHIGIAMPVAIYSHSRELGTVFHMKTLVCRAADQLFDAGFRDIEGYNARGLTPLMALHFVNLFGSPHPHLFFWFVSKGASLLTFQRNRNWHALHYIAAQFCEICAHRWTTDADKDSHRLTPHINGISYTVTQSGNAALVARISDHFSCACSSAGFTISISVIKAYSSSIRRFNPEYISTWLPGSRLEYVDFWLSLVQLEPTVVAEIIVEVLRLILFEELGLSHTCCWFNYENESRMFEYDTKLENRTMIQQEEADIINHLEDLLELAISRWHNFSGPLSEFLRKFIMDEIDHNPTDWDEEYT